MSNGGARAPKNDTRNHRYPRMCCSVAFALAAAATAATIYFAAPVGVVCFR